MRLSLLLLVPLILMENMTDAASDAPPKAAMKDHVSTWHGEAVNDPWFWLREKTNPEVIRYLEAENAYTEAHNGAVKRFGEALYKEMLGRIKQTDLSVPERRGAYYYYSRTEEGKQYPIRCRRPAQPDGSDDLKAPEQILLDDNEQAKGHTYFSVGSFQVSDDGHQLLFSTDVTGFRQYTLYKKDLQTGATSGPLAERVTSASWMADGLHLVYATEDPVTKRSDKLWRRTPDGAPELLFEEKDELYRVGIGRTRDRAHLVLQVTSTDTWEAWTLAAKDYKGRLKVVLPRDKGHKYDVDVRDGLLYIRTNKAAKNFRVVTATFAEPTKWTEIIPHREDTLLENIDLFAGHMAVWEKREALPHLRIFDFGSKTWLEVKFPEPVYAAYSAGTYEWNAKAVRIRYQSMVTPDTVYDVRLGDGVLVERKRTEVLGGYDPKAYVTERRWATARDGVRIPLSVLYKKGTRRDQHAPCFLYGYGSYGFGMQASFSISRLSLVDRGMVFVIAHIRGGDEMGERWHDDGMLMKKKNTFFDFIDTAESLIREGVTSKDRLVIEGASAGGLLMGAVTNLRPDLWKAVHASVPFVDMMNTMMDASLPLTIGEYLEWGDPNQRPAFDYMRSYSPYDNLEKKAYPAMLVTTSLNDSQVMYWEPAKYVAKMRHLRSDKNPLYLKCNMGAGHGGASGRYDRLKEVSFEYAWLMSQVGITK